MLTGKTTDWSDERNRKLANALTILEDETCKGCGTPAWIGHSTNNEIVFDLKSSICYPCAELEREREAMEKGRGGRARRKGETRYPAPRNVWGTDHALPSRAHAYQHDMPKEEV
jgi:hypothetical protein